MRYKNYVVMMKIVSLQGKAKGQLYSDDGHSLDYKKGQYLLRDFQFIDNKLTSR